MKVLIIFATFALALGQISARYTREDQNDFANLAPGCYDGSISAVDCCEGVTAFWIHLPDPQDCTKFYHCDNGKAVHKDCPAHLHWSIKDDRCEWPEIAGCQGNPGSGNGNGTTAPPTTPGGDENGQCIPAPICHNCLTGLFPSNLCCQGVSNWQKIHLANQNDCSSYLECVNEEAVLRRCPEGLQWSTNTDRCEWPHDSDCGSGNNSEEENGSEGGDNNEEACKYGNVDAKECCKNVSEQEDVLLQNNADCHTYYQCVHGQPWIRPCPSNLWWSATRNRCEWIENATCTW